MYLKLKLKLKTFAHLLLFMSFFITLDAHATPPFLLHSNRDLIQKPKERPLLATNLDESPVKLKDVFMTQKDVSYERAEMEAKIVVLQSQPDRLLFKVHYGMNVVVLDTFLGIGEHRFSLPFVILKPVLSRANGSDAPFLYTFRAFVTNSKGQSDEMQLRIGLRPVESVKKQIYTEAVLVDKNSNNHSKTVNMTPNQASNDAKNSKEDVFLSLKIEHDTFKLTLQNNRPKRAMGDFIVDVFDRNGRLLFNDVRLLRIGPNSQMTFYRYDLATMLQGARPSDVVIITTWKDVDNLPNEMKKIFYVESTNSTITNGQ